MTGPDVPTERVTADERRPAGRGSAEAVASDGGRRGARRRACREPWRRRPRDGAVPD